MRTSRVGLWGFGLIVSSVTPAPASILIGSDVVSDQLLQISTQTGSGSVIGPLGDPVVAGLTWDANHDILYGSSTQNRVLVKIDPDNGVTSVVGPFGVGLMHGIEYDCNHDVLYGITNQSTSKGLYTIDVTTGAATLVAHHSHYGLSGLAFDAANDVMYASEAHERALYRINLSDGSTSRIGSFGVGMQLGVGLAYDPVLGMFASDNHASSHVDDKLYRIDPLTAEATLVGDIDFGNVLGLTFIPEPGALLLLTVGALLALQRRRRC